MRPIHHRTATLAFVALFATCVRGAEIAESGRTFRGPAGNIYFEIRGGGPALPLILVNGGPGFDHLYLHVSDVWDRVAKERPVVFYDQRGVGRSDALKAGQSCTLADQIADLEALRSHLGYERFDLLGHSWGGYLVMAYAARYPSRIAHLVICDSAAPKFDDTVFLFKQVFPEGSERQDAVAFADELGDASATEVGLKEYFAMLFYSPERRDAFLAGTKEIKVRKHVNEAVVADLHGFDLNPELAKFRFPVLVLTGRYDMNVAPSVAWKIRKAIPDADFGVFERSGHLPFYEEPEAFLQRLEAFLQKPAS